MALFSLCILLGVVAGQDVHDPLNRSVVDRWFSYEKFQQRRTLYSDTLAGIMMGDWHDVRNGTLRMPATQFDPSHNCIPADRATHHNFWDVLLPHVSMQLQIGFVYSCFLHGCLNSTAGPPGSEAWYIFNPHHKIIQPWNDAMYKKPNVQTLGADSALVKHIAQFNEKRHEFYKIDDNDLMTLPYWPPDGLEWPLWRDFYTSDILSKDMREIAVVAGKTHHEFNDTKDPVNSFAKPADLERILDVLVQRNFLVIYSNNYLSPNLTDLDIGGIPIKSEADVAFIRNSEKYVEKVLFLEDLWDQVKALRETALDGTPRKPTDIMSEPLARRILQFLVYASTKLFVTTQGEPAHTAASFGKSNYILHYRGMGSPNKHCETYTTRVMVAGQRPFWEWDVDMLVLEMNANLEVEKVAVETFELFGD